MIPPEGWPEDLRAAFERKVAEFWAQPDAESIYEYVDRSRTCRVGNAEEERAFDDIAAGGCCGSHEVEWELDIPSGKATVRYGFNYGH